MQWNCTNPFLHNLNYDPFSFSKAPSPSYPQIIGEGDVTSIILPDGTIQLLFVPTHRHVTTNKDVWFVRSISHPVPSSLLNRLFPNVSGDQQAPYQFFPNLCVSSPPPPDYCQKFHNDDSTSTTDIHYFYPSLRYNGNLKYSAETQTEPLTVNTALCRCQGHCACKSARDASASSTSYMSVDSTSRSKHRLTIKKKKKTKPTRSRESFCDYHSEVKNSNYQTRKSRDPHCKSHLESKRSKYITNKSCSHSRDSDLETKKTEYKSNKCRDSLCKCHLERRETSNKLVSTFAEKASGGIVKDGRPTQTSNQRSKRSDVQTEIWQPVQCHYSYLDCSDRCCCRSTSETDD